MAGADAEAIVVDWGAKNFRAWLVNIDSGEVLGEIPEGRGMRDLARQELPGYCRAVLSRWRDNPRRAVRPPVYMAGMVGSQIGWLEAPQPPLPQAPEDLASCVVEVPNMQDAFIIPGVRVEEEEGRIDVMRGEEVQIFGALSITGKNDTILCLPGNHSKWAEARGGKLIRFTTNMTGEVYNTMLDNTILGKPADRKAPWNDAAFERGLEQSTHDGGLLDHLFVARSRYLYGGLRSEHIAPFLSGLLIGHEVRAMDDHYHSGGQEVLLVCSEALRGPYERALTYCGHATRWIDGRAATVAGVAAIIRRHQAAGAGSGTPAGS